jgi:hypothetical protein
VRPAATLATPAAMLFSRSSRRLRRALGMETLLLAVEGGGL